MWWKLYFWFLLVLCIFEVGSFFEAVSNWDIISMLLLGELAVFALAAFAFVYKKNVLPASVWQLLLVLVVLFDVGRFIFIEFIPGRVTWQQLFLINSAMATAMLVLVLLVILPAWYALFKLGFVKKQKHTRKKSR